MLYRRLVSKCTEPTVFERRNDQKVMMLNLLNNCDQLSVCFTGVYQGMFSHLIQRFRSMYLALVQRYQAND